MKKTIRDKQLDLKIYMIREGFEEPEDILKTDRYENQYNMDEKGVKGTLFLSQLKKREVPFLEIYRPYIEVLPRFYTGRISAVFLCEAEGRRFAVTHGSGWSWFKDGVVEQSFGLIVALNLLEPERLKVVETATLNANPLLTRQQLARGGDSHDFRLDIFQDLLKSVSGECFMEDPPVKLGGKDALHFQAAIKLPEVLGYLPVFAEAFDRDALPEVFQWVNGIQPIRDKLLKDKLNGDLLGQIHGGDGRVSLAPPLVLSEAEDIGFKYPKSGETEVHRSLSLADYLNTLGLKARHGLTVNMLTRDKVSVWSPEGQTFTPRWSIYKCLGAEVVRDGFCYVLNDGDWHQVAREFYDKLEKDVSLIPVIDLKLPAWNMSCKENDERNAEKKYNELVHAQWGEKNAALLDADNIYIRGNQRFEFCDVMHKDGTLLHVKRATGSTALGHLINQGLVSGEAFTDKTVREKLQKKLPEGIKFEDPNKPVDPRRYNIVYAIAQEGDGPPHLPFFSKLTLRRAFLRLHGELGYRVSLTKIQVNRWSPTTFDKGNGPVRSLKPNQAA